MVDVADARRSRSTTRQTGVSDGKVEAARRYSPCSARKRSAGASALSNIDGVRPSMTTRTTGFGAGNSVPRERAQPRVRVGRAPAQPAPESRHGERLEVADARGRTRAQRRRARRGRAGSSRPAARAAAAQRAGDERRRAERAAEPRRRAPPTASSHWPNAKPRATATAAPTTSAEEQRGEARRSPRRRARCRVRPGSRSCTSRPRATSVRPTPPSSRAITARVNCGGAGPVDDAVVEGDADVPHPADDDLPVADDRRAARCGGRRGCRPRGG